MLASKSGERSSGTDLKPNGSTGYATRRSILGSDFNFMLGNDQKSVWPDVRSDRRKACRFAPNEPDVWPRPSINFTDSQLQKCYESNLAEAADLSGELRQVRALIAVYDLFQMLEGPHSSRVHETVWRLLLPKLRPGLRRWYQRFGADKNPAAIALRDHLSQLAGEKLENVTDIPHNPS